jgi:hypothetical protein
METMRGKRGGVKAVAGLGLVLGLLVAGMARPESAAAGSLQIQPSRPGMSGGRSISPAPAQGQGGPQGQWYGSVPDRGRDGDRHWGHDGGRRDGWGHPGGYYWHGWPGWGHGHAGWAPGPYYRPGQWVWNGWGWVWVPGYRY